MSEATHQERPFDLDHNEHKQQLTEEGEQFKTWRNEPAICEISYRIFQALSIINPLRHSLAEPVGYEVDGPLISITFDIVA